MFGYVSSKGVLISQTFCLICTTIIADNEGYVADTSHTEVENKDGQLSVYYRAYYEMVVGRHNLTTENTEGGLRLDNYNTDFYDKISQRYNVNHGKDSFIKLNSSEQFDTIFREALIPTVINTVNMELSESGYSKKELDDYSSEFKKLFLVQFRCKLDEFTLTNSNIDEAWKDLYDMAVGMPHTIIGLRKKVSSANSTFFRQNRDNLDVLLFFMRRYFNEEVSTPFKSYKDGFRISGIIVDTFEKYLLGRFMNDYAMIVSSSSAVFEDDEGVLLNGSETQEKMHSSSPVLYDIDDFENLISLIDRGSSIYDMAGSRYFNLIAWRQNKIKKDVVNILSNTQLARKLDKLGLSIGGYLDNSEIANLSNRFTQDKKIRIERIDSIISDGFNINLDGDIARRKIDEWLKSEMDEYHKVNGKVSDSEALKSGRSVLSFKYKDKNSDGTVTNRMTTHNHMMFKNLLIGIQSLHILESEINNMDYHFLSFPIKLYKDNDYKLVTGLTLGDYLKFDNSVSNSVNIVCDVVGDDSLKDQYVIEDVSRINGEILSIINNNSDIEDIPFNSLADDSEMIVDGESDAELLRFLRYNNIKINIKNSKKTETIKDVVFNDIVNSISDSINSNFIPFKSFYNGLIKKSSDNVSREGRIIARVKFTSLIIETYSYYGNLTHSISDDSLNNILDITSLYYVYKKKDFLSLDKLTELSGRVIISSDMDDLLSNLFCEQNIQLLLSNKNRLGKFYKKSDSTGHNICNAFSARNSSGKIGISSLGLFVTVIDSRLRKYDTGKDVLGYDTLKVVCKSLTKYTNKVFGTEFDDSDGFYLPRAICFGVNVCVITNYIVYALKGIAEHLSDEQSFLKDMNSDDVVNIRLIIKTILALDNINNIGIGYNYINVLKVCERLFSDFMDSVDIDKINGKSVSSIKYRKFIFMDSIQVYTNDVDDIEERAIQYIEISKYVNSILNNKAVFSIKFGGMQYSLSGFMRVLEMILNFEKKQRDNEYLVNRVSRSEIDISIQEKISSTISNYISRNKDDFYIDDSAIWLDNLKEYFSNNIYNAIKLNYNDYEINEFGFLTLNGKVVHTIQYSSNGHKFIIVATRYGLFRYRDGCCNYVDKMEDLKWMLY